MKSAFLGLLLLSGVIQADYPNLQELKSPFVIETKRIIIPDSLDAFNPTIIRWGEGILMCYRVGNYLPTPSGEVIRLPLYRSTREMGFVFLDRDFNVISKPQIVQMPLGPSYLGLLEQDPRLILVDDKLTMVYSDLVMKDHLRTRRVCLSEITFDGILFHAKAPLCLLDYEGEIPARFEKNWVPFDYQGHLLLSYKLSPHKVFMPLDDGSCLTISTSEKALPWEYGELRGGTQAFLIDGEYLSFFHSSKEMKTVHSKGKKISHYFMGAYTFEDEPPFTVTKISPEPLIGDNFYEGEEYPTWKPLFSIFPAGYIYDDNYIWVSYGRQDHEMWVCKIDRKALYDSLKICPK